LLLLRNYITRPRLSVAVLAILLAVCGYAIWVEPYWLEVTFHTFPARVDSPLKIAHLSDLHTRRFGRLEKKILRTVEAEKPDLILISGDSTLYPEGISALREVLAGLRAPLGVWTVRGNWENSTRLPNEREFFEALGVKLLVNDATSVRKDVWVAGFDDPQFGGFPIVEATLQKIPAGAFRLALFHAPILFDQMGDRVDLALSGHTHGGQIRLPFLPPFYLPPESGAYWHGWYENGTARMYVSRGIGMSVLEARFMARPEIAFITLRPIKGS